MNWPNPAGVLAATPPALKPACIGKKNEAPAVSRFPLASSSLAVIHLYTESSLTTGRTAFTSSVMSTTAPIAPRASITCSISSAMNVFSTPNAPAFSAGVRAGVLLTSLIAA